MKKIRELLLKHKILSLLCLVSFVFIIILSYFFFSIFMNGSNKYGNRLEGIKNVNISDKRLDKLESSLEDMGEVDKANVRIQGKIVYVNIIFKNETSLDKAKEIANGTLESFKDKEKKYYDFGFFLTQVGTDKEEDNSKYYKITGNMHAGKDKITYIKK